MVFSLPLCAATSYGRISMCVFTATSYARICLEPLFLHGKYPPIRRAAATCEGFSFARSCVTAMLHARLSLESSFSVVTVTSFGRPCFALFLQCHIPVRVSTVYGNASYMCRFRFRLPCSVSSQVFCFHSNPVNEMTSHPCLCLAGAHYINMLQCHMQDPFSHVLLSVAAPSYRRIRFAEFVLCFSGNVIWTKLVRTRFLFSQQRPMDELSSHPCLCIAGAHYINVLHRRRQDPFSHVCLSVSAPSY